MGRKKKELIITIKPGEIWDSAQKTLFRKTRLWTEFRNKLVKERKRCELCGYEKRLTAHHIYMNDSAESYSDLSEKRFKILCSGCHKFIHRVWSSYKRKKDPIKPDIRFEVILNEIIKD